MTDYYKDKCVRCLKTECECKNTTSHVAANPVKSDGGSSSYYQLKMKLLGSAVSNIAGSSNVNVDVETGDIIRALVDNDFDLGNVIKACRRIHQAKKGEGKAGTDVEYDLKKIKYFLDEWYKAYCLERL